MINKKYSAQFKIEIVEEYLERIKKEPKLSKAEFASEKGISDSTFNDWVLKYKRQGAGFCNITTELIKLKDVEIISPKENVVRIVEDSQEPISKNIVRMTYNGAIIEFDESLLERALKVLKEW